MRLAENIIDDSPIGFKANRVCGIDVAYRSNVGFAAAVVWDLPSSTFAYSSNASMDVTVDYLPGFLGFREGPLVVELARTVMDSIGVFMVDGHGRVHPRRFGLACHVGLALGRPTIGIAKSRFYGREVDDWIVSPDGTVLGKIVRTKGGKAFYVSIGHMISLEDAVTIVKRCIVGEYCVPLREAHLSAERLRRAG